MCDRKPVSSVKEALFVRLCYFYELLSAFGVAFPALNRQEIREDVVEANSPFSK